MKYHYTDWPRFISRDEYTASINSMVELVSNSGMAQSIYQVGSVGTPGISDVDLVVILHENLKTDFNPVSGLSGNDRYLFSHRLFGTVIPFALHLEKYVLFGNYEHLWGHRFDLLNSSLSSNDLKILKYQIALEYLLKAWISNSISIYTGIVKVRNLLLHAKGILHDIRFLELENSKLEKCINKIIKQRESWFESPLNESELDLLTDEYQNALEEALNVAINTHGFYMPVEANKQIGKKISITYGDQLQFKPRGILLPYLKGKAGSYVTKINNRINSYTVALPFNQTEVPNVIRDRYYYLREAFKYNGKHLPGFICTGHGIDIFSS